MTDEFLVNIILLVGGVLLLAWGQNWPTACGTLCLLLALADRK